jgi:hypothetical protein
MKSISTDPTSDEMLSEIYSTFQVNTHSARQLMEYHKLLSDVPHQKTVRVGSFNASKKSN